jgi:hypothetical protein
MKSIADEIFELAKKIAHRTPGFQHRRGPGKTAGNGVTSRFLSALNQEVAKQFAGVCRLQEPVAPGVKYSFDFFIPCENTSVEIALSLRNVVTEFEKDIFKAILATESGKRVKKLTLIGKGGSVKRQNEPGPNAIKSWVRHHYGIEIDVRELL